MTNPKLLTKKQMRFYSALESHIKKHRKSPTIAELQKNLELSSPRAVSQYLEVLERRGLITRSRYAERGIQLVGDALQHGATTVTIPVIASAGCDQMSVFAERTFGDFICISSEMLGNKKKESVVSIKAIGDSMNEAGVHNGDYVLVEVTEQVSDNDLVVAIVDHFAVIKKIEFANNAVILKPVSSDPQYKPIILRRDFQIFGKVMDIIRLPQKGDLEIVPLYSKF